jgi:DNA-binding LacI/PurR family transcriptional regulator
MTTPRPHSIAANLVDSLRERLQAGEWTGYLPSERELCERFRVSRPTLRKALTILSDEGRVRPEHGMGWQIEQPTAATVDARKSKAVGILCLVPLDQATPFNLFMIDKLQEHLTAAGLQVHTHAGHQYASRNLQIALQRLVRSSPPSVWVLFGSLTRTRAWFLQRSIPVFDALANRREHDIPGVYVDLCAVLRHAVGRLTAAGHRRIVFVRHMAPNPVASGSVEASVERDEIEAFQEALEHHGARSPSVPGVVQHAATPQSVRKVIGTLLKSSHPPTALVVRRPQHALTTLTYLMHLGMRVPRDMSVVCIGYQPILDHVTPAITHYDFNRQAYARKLTSLVLSWATTGYWTAREGEVTMLFRRGETLAPPPA